MQPVSEELLASEFDPEFFLASLELQHLLVSVERAVLTIRLALLLAVAAFAASPATAANHTVGFDQSTYQIRFDETFPVQILIDPVPNAGLASFGVRLRFDPTRAEVIGASSVSVQPPFADDGPRAQSPVIAVGPGFAATKATTPFFAKPPATSANSLLTTFFLRNRSRDPYELTLELFNTLGPTEQVFVDGQGRGIDPNIRFASATVNPSDVVTLATDLGPVLNRQTGLFEQVVTISNGRSTSVSGLRLSVSVLPTSWHVWNASGTNALGIPFLAVNSALAPGGRLNVRVEFRIPDRNPNQHPSYSLEESAPLIIRDPIGESFAVQPRVRLPDGAFLLEFNTLAQRQYAIQYSRNLTNWITVVPAHVGNGSRSQWIDYGPPKTDRPPGADTNRFYRVFLLP